MGTYRKRKHYNDNGNGNESSAIDNNQTKLSEYPPITRSETEEYLIPILKEIGKAIFPAAAPIIEAAYQLYKHHEAIKEASSAALAGDYEKATEVIVKEGVKTSISNYIGEKMAPPINEGAELAETAAHNLPTSEQGKDLAGKVAKGTIKGTAEVIKGKIVNKVANGVIKDEEG